MHGFTVSYVCHSLFSLEHALCTTLQNVGNQVWRGSLLLADFLLYYNGNFESSTILELGGGVGLVSIVASLFCHLVFCTGKAEVCILTNYSCLVRNTYYKIKLEE